MKIRCLFEFKHELDTADELLEEQVTEVERWARRRNTMGLWRDQVRGD